MIAIFFWQSGKLQFRTYWFLSNTQWFWYCWELERKCIYRHFSNPRFSPLVLGNFFSEHMDGSSLHGIKSRLQMDNGFEDSLWKLIRNSSNLELFTQTKINSVCKKFNLSFLLQSTVFNQVMYPEVLQWWDVHPDAHWFQSQANHRRGLNQPDVRNHYQSYQQGIGHQIQKNTGITRELFSQW